jgi:FMN phosphatase YigB (HAD superfamily)
MQDIERGDLVIDWVEVKLDQKKLIRVKRWVEKDIAWIMLYPEFLEIIEYLKSKWYKTAVVSNLAKPYEEPLNWIIPEWTFDYKALSFDIWAMKPNPKIFEHIHDVSWIDYDKMVFIWDSMSSDVLWSAGVWMKPIFLNRRHKHIFESWEKHWVNYIQIWTLDQLRDIL